MALFRDCCVVPVLAWSHRQAMLPHCAQGRLALTKNPSTGGFFYE